MKTRKKKTLSKSKLCRKLLCISQEKQKRTEYKDKINVLFKLLFTAYSWLWVNSLSLFPHSGFCCLSRYNIELWKAKDKQWQHRHSCEMQMEIWGQSLSGYSVQCRNNLLTSSSISSWSYSLNVDTWQSLCMISALHCYVKYHISLTSSQPVSLHKRKHFYQVNATLEQCPYLQEEFGEVGE